MYGRLVVVRLCAIWIVGLSGHIGPGLKGEAASNSDECRDFYSYACKGSTEKLKAVNSRNRALEWEKHAARSHSIEASEQSPFKSYYMSCLNRDGSVRFLESKFKQIIRQTYLGPPIKEEDLAKLLDETSMLNNGFFESGYEGKNKNTFAIVARIQVESMEIDKNDQADLFKEYAAFIKTLFEELDCLYDENEWNKVLYFEQEIIKLVETIVNGKNISYFFNNRNNKRNIFYLPNKPVTHYVMDQIRNELKPKEGSRFKLFNFFNVLKDQIESRDENAKVIFLELDYFKELQKIFSKYELKIIARYIMLRSILSFYFTLPQRFQDMAQNISSPLKNSLSPWLIKNEDNCKNEAIGNLKYLEDQYYMDKSFSGKIGDMAGQLYRSVKTNLENIIKADKCLSSEDKISTFLQKIGTMSVHLGRFDLPYAQYKKTSFYNGSYFENVLASKRDFIRTIAVGEKGVGRQNLTSLWEARKLFYYEESTNTLYFMSYVFNTSAELLPEFFGSASPHVVDVLLEVIGKENWGKCSNKERKTVIQFKGNPEEFILWTKLALSVKAYQDQNPENENELQRFFLSFTREFCYSDIKEEERNRLNKVLSSNLSFKKAFNC